MVTKRRQLSSIKTAGPMAMCFSGGPGLKSSPKEDVRCEVMGFAGGQNERKAGEVVAEGVEKGGENCECPRCEPERLTACWNRTNRWPSREIRYTYDPAGAPFLRLERRRHRLQSRAKLVECGLHGAQLGAWTLGGVQVERGGVSVQSQFVSENQSKGTSGSFLDGRVGDFSCFIASHYVEDHIDRFDVSGLQARAASVNLLNPRPLFIDVEIHQFPRVPQVEILAGKTPEWIISGLCSTVKEMHSPLSPHQLEFYKP
nr:hypothetical protein B23L21.140 [imported] - Neurospora crassa [Neurospora crassa]